MPNGSSRGHLGTRETLYFSSLWTQKNFSTLFVHCSDLSLIATFFIPENLMVTFNNFQIVITLNLGHYCVELSPLRYSHDCPVTIQIFNTIMIYFYTSLNTFHLLHKSKPLPLVWKIYSHKIYLMAIYFHLTEQVKSVFFWKLFHRSNSLSHPQGQNELDLKHYLWE